MRLWAAAAVVGAAAIGLGGCTPTSTDPSPSASVIPAVESPSPVPSVTTDAEGRALPGFVTEHPELPPALPAPDGILDTTAAGWSLQAYRPEVAPVVLVSGITPGFEPTVQVVYLVSPEGRRYQLLELDPSVPVVIQSWTAREAVAYVSTCEPLDCDPNSPVQTLDLLTGEIAPVEAVEGLHISATLAGSYRWWEQPSGGSVLDSRGSLRPLTQRWAAHSVSPSGKYLAVERVGSFNTVASAGMAIVDPSTGALIDLGRLWSEPLSCEPFRWRVDDALDVHCWDDSREMWRVFTVGPGATVMKENKAASATPPEEGPWVEPDFFVTEGVWAGPYSADAGERRRPVATIGLARNAGFEVLTAPDAVAGTTRIVTSVGGSLYLEASPAHNPTLVSAWRFDPSTDEWTELAPLPPTGPTRGFLAGEGSPASGMSSWVVAP